MQKEIFKVSLFNLSWAYLLQLILLAPDLICFAIAKLSHEENRKHWFWLRLKTYHQLQFIKQPKVLLQSNWLLSTYIELKLKRNSLYCYSINFETLIVWYPSQRLQAEKILSIIYYCLITFYIFLHRYFLISMDLTLFSNSHFSCLHQ